VDAERAISLVLEEIRAGGLDYPVAGLRAEAFNGGWCVYAPEMLADGDPLDDVDVTRSVFLVGGSGRVKEISSSRPVHEARDWFEEACIWFSAEEPDQGKLDFSLPSHPDLSGLGRPRPSADYDRAAVDVLARALTHERDFADWLGDRLRELADLLGGGSRLIARRPNSWAAGHVRELAEPHAGDESPTEVWRTWPAVDPASLPDADTTGWLLIPGARTVEFLESLEGETDAATRLADAIADRANQAPPWQACGVAELTPQLVAVPRGELRDADLDTLRRLAAQEQARAQADEQADELAEAWTRDLLGMLVVTPAPGDADVETLLRLAVDADRHHREAIALDAAATAAYRRVLDRLDLPFENLWLEAMFE
jgi:hypothetical protein